MAQLMPMVEARPWFLRQQPALRALLGAMDRANPKARRRTDGLLLRRQ